MKYGDMKLSKKSDRTIAKLCDKYHAILKERLTKREYDVVLELLEVERELTLREQNT